MAISTIGQNGLTVPLTSNTITSASATALTLQSAGTTAVTIDTSQNVGIGTSSPTATGGYDKALDVVGGANGAGLYVRGSTNPSTVYGAIQYDNYSNRTNINAVGTNNFLRFVTVDTERMRIDSSGNLLVGTTSQTPGYTNTNTGVQLSNNGSHFSRGATDWVMTVNQNTADGSARYLIGFRVSNGQVGNIQSNGTNCTYNSNSDYRLKENVQPMQNALGKVARLNPVTYKWKLDGSDGEGFIAHELAEVVPECVTGEKDAVDADGNPVYQGIDTSFLVATLTAAIQELKAELDELKAKVNA